jgi:hypothetical protein
MKLMRMRRKMKRWTKMNWTKRRRKWKKMRMKRKKEGMPRKNKMKTRGIGCFVKLNMMA